MAAEAEKKEGLWETVKTVIWALVIAIVFRSLFFQPFWIPSGSMKDTLLIGDFLFVNKMAYGYSEYSCMVPIVNVSLCPFIEERILDREPQRGDVIVFRHPVTGDDYIKRLVGMPGDTVQMRAGRLYLNGTEVPAEPAAPFVETYEPQGPQRIEPRCENRPVGIGEDCVKQRVVETLPNGVAHSVLNIVDQNPSQRNTDNTPVYTVPAGEYFFMGDNRDNSSDSRVPQSNGGVGFVPYENLIGRADRVIFSSAGSRMLYFWTWRLDRFFEEIV